MKTDETTTVRLWLSPEELAEREQQRLADEYQRDAIAEAMSEAMQEQFRKDYE